LAGGLRAWVQGERQCRMLLVDCDDCLYSADAGIAQRVFTKICDYMRSDKVGIPEAEVEDLCIEAWASHGLTMHGLRERGHVIDKDDWHRYVHDLDYASHLKPDAALRAMLLRLKVPAVVFSNADKVHVTKCLEQLGVADCFRGIVCYDDMNPDNSTSVCKPSVEAFQVAMDKALDCVGIPVEERKDWELGHFLFLDDSTRNVAGSAKAGVRAVRVGTTEPCDGASLALKQIHHLEAELPELFNPI